MLITIHVTQEMIDHAEPLKSTGCPVVLALRSVIDARFADGVCVGPDAAYTLPYFRMRLPEAAVEFIGHFDLKKPVGPFSFELNVPTECLRKESHPVEPLRLNFLAPVLAEAMEASKC